MEPDNQARSIAHNREHEWKDGDNISSDSNNLNYGRNQILSSDSNHGLSFRSESTMHSELGGQQPKQNDDFVDWEEKAPRARIIMMTSFFVCLFTISTIIVYGVIENKEIIYKESKRTSNKTFYTKKEKVTYPVLFNAGLGLLGIVLGFFLDRLCLVLENLYQCQIKNRCSYECKHSIQECFSDISWKTLILVSLMAIVTCSVGRKTPIKIADAIYVFGGIGAGPLLIRLLSLNKKPEIALSRILEAQKMYPGYTLAWAYYFVTLRKTMEQFNDIILRKDLQLSFNRLILLLIQGTDIKNIDDLVSYDDYIERTQKTNDDQHKLPIFKLKLKTGEHRIFAMVCVRGPLVALKEMKESQKVRFVNDKNYHEEMNRFLKTLTNILEDAPHDECTKKGLVVPVTVKIGQYENLNHGGLVRIIMAKVNNQSAVMNDSRLPHTNRNIQKVKESKPLKSSGGASSSDSEQDTSKNLARTFRFANAYDSQVSD